MEKVIDRIRKLLALAGNNTSENEREQALAKAHAMLLEYNLSMSDLGQQEEIDIKVDAAARRTKYRSAPWVIYISASIAELYFCKYYHGKQGNGTLNTYVGTRADAEVAHAVTQMVLDSVWGEALMFMRRNGRDPKMVMEFVNAAASVIYRRCVELRRAAEGGKTAESTGRALVVVDLYKTRLDAAEKWINENVRLRKGRTNMRVKNSEAAAAGASHGKNVPLTMSVGAKATKAIK